MTRRTAMLRLTPEEFDRWQASCRVCGHPKLWCVCKVNGAEAAPAKPASRKVLVATEAETLGAVLSVLRLMKDRVAWAYRSNTGAGYLINARLYHELVERGHLNAKDCRYMRFGVPGAADITGMMLDGRRLEVEVKREDGKLTDEQRAFLDAVNGAKGVGFVARRIEDVAEGLK